MKNVNWKYFVTAAEELNFTKAAAKLYISQQSLSNYIVKLEESLGIELFNRKNNLSLTKAGESLYNNAKKILVIEELAQKELKDIKDFKTSSLRIGISRQRGSVILPEVLPKLKQIYPELKVELVEKGIRELHKELLEGQIDLMFGYAVDRNPELEYEIFDHEKLMLVISESVWQRYLSEEKREEIMKMDSAPLEAFIKCPFILLKGNGWTSNTIHKYCEQQGIKLNEIFYTISMNTMLNLALVGLGATICPKVYLQEKFIDKIYKEPVYFIKLEDKLFSPDMAVIYNKKHYLPKVARDFIDIVKEGI